MTGRTAAGRPLLTALIASALVGVPSANAQVTGRSTAPQVQPEVRTDYIDSRAPAAHVGVGFSVPVGTYVRVGGIVAAGQAWIDGEPTFGGRIDALARFVVDPLRESRWAPYAAGGIGGLFDEHDDWRAVLVGTLGIEGPPLRRLVPAFEIGFGGGARVGIALRRAIPGRR